MRRLSLLLVVAGWWSIGCAPLSRGLAGERPADLALIFHVRQPGGRHELYLVQPDRTLRAAMGSDVGRDYFPPTTAALTPGQMDELWRSRPTEIAADRGDTGSVDRTLHDVTITHEGRVDRVLAEPGRYAVMLAKLRSWSGLEPGRE